LPVGNGPLAVSLFDAHPPFEINGNFGCIAGVGEMLLQSHASKIQLLPALSKAWPSGKISGLCACGSFPVDIEWKDGRVASYGMAFAQAIACPSDAPARHRIDRDRDDSQLVPDLARRFQSLAAGANTVMNSVSVPSVST